MIKTATGRLATILTALIASTFPASAQSAPPPTVLDSRRPEPILFDVMRRLRDAPIGQGRLALRRQLDEWRARAHDGAIKIGSQWTPATELQRRRERYILELAIAEDVLKQIPRRAPTTPAERAALKRMTSNASQKFEQAARVWADPLIRNFLLGQTALEAGDYRQAERLFDQCVRAQPLVAGFWQGRAMARDHVGRPLNAVADWMALSRLRPNSPIAVEGLRQALSNVPGGMINRTEFKEATLRLREIDDAEARPRRSNARRGTAWLMPGGDWQGVKGGLPVPNCDALFTRKTVAVPVSADGVLLIDANALDGALEMLLETAPGQYVPVEIAKLRSSALRDLDLPLAVVRVQGCSFEAVEMAPEPGADKGDSLTIVVHSLPGELGASTPRQYTATVKDVADGEAPILSAYPLAGESGGPVFNASGALVTFVTGRTYVFADAGGPAKALRPADVAEYVGAAAKARGRSRRSRRNRPTAQPRLLRGRTFTLHIIAGSGVTP